MRSLVSAVVLSLLLAPGCGADERRAGAELEAPKQVPAQNSREPMDIRSFVRQSYVHGIPYEEATRYDAARVPALMDMLRDPAEEAFHANIVSTLGIIGNEDVAETLIELIEGGQGEISREVYAAKTAAVTALGHLVHRTGSERALDYLLKSLDLQNWEERDVRWTSPFLYGAEERNLQLVRLAVMALALSGHPRAGEALDSPKSQRLSPEFRAELSALLAEAAAAHEFISREGLVEYYKGLEN